MRRVKVLNMPVPIADLPFDSYFDQIDQEWRIKARRLQAKRWRKFKQLEN